MSNGRSRATQSMSPCARLRRCWALNLRMGDITPLRIRLIACRVALQFLLGVEVLGAFVHKASVREQSEAATSFGRCMVHAFLLDPEPNAEMVLAWGEDHRVRSPVAHDR